MSRRYLLFVFLWSMCIACKPAASSRSKEVAVPLEHESKSPGLPDDKQGIPVDFDTSQWFEIVEVPSIDLDLRYASKDNFVGQQIYPCGRCFFRPELGRRIKTLANDIYTRYGWSLRLFDCYRPRPAQQRLWDAKPDARYVTKPTKGSMHNRGLAVDITILNQEGEAFDMGSAFDHLGPASHTDRTDLAEDIQKNRRILSKIMKLHGLSGIRTEWWHYSLKTVSAPLDDWEWSCD